MKIEKLCINCMQERRSPDGICEFCGFDVRTFELPRHHMRPFTILAGKYLIGNAIGEGGFGITYIGMDLNLEVKVAIKEYYPQGAAVRDCRTNDSTVWSYSKSTQVFFEEGREKFINEAKTIAKFRNVPEIVGVIDFFRENQTAYIVMEYLDGQTLKQYLKVKGGKIPADELLRMMKPLIASLGKLHAQGLIHRDISPDNIMIMKDGSIKILDFGGARDFVSQNGKSMSVLVKHGYAPEEQYRSRGDQGPWTDVYALCATMYRCITGKIPPEALDRLYEDELKPISSFGVNCPKCIEQAITKGLSVRKDGRYQSMEELYDALYKKQKEPEKPTKTDKKKTQQSAEINNKTKRIMVAVVVAAVGIAVIAGVGIKMKQPDEKVVAKAVVTPTPSVKAEITPTPTLEPTAVAVPEPTQMPEESDYNQNVLAGNMSVEEFKNLKANEAYDFQIVMKSFSSPYWDAVREGIEKASEELGVTYMAVGPHNETDIANQVNMLNVAIASPETSGIGLAVCDSTSVVDALQTSAEKGTPIVTFDTEIANAPEGSVVCNIDTDGMQIGAIAAEKIYNAIKEVIAVADGQVMIGEVNCSDVDTKVQQRGTGFINKMIELIQADGKTVAVTGNEFYVNAATGANASEVDADVVIQVTVPVVPYVRFCIYSTQEDILSKENCLAVFASDQITSEGLIMAGRNVLGLDATCGDVIGVGTDAGSITKAAVADGTLLGAVTGSPMQMGYYTIYALTAAANGQLLEDVSIEGCWYDSTNMNDADISPALYD